MFSVAPLRASERPCSGLNGRPLIMRSKSRSAAFLCAQLNSVKQSVATVGSRPCPPLDKQCNDVKVNKAAISGESSTYWACQACTENTQWALLASVLFKKKTQIQDVIIDFKICQRYYGLYSQSSRHPYWHQFAFACRFRTRLWFTSVIITILSEDKTFPLL